MLHLTPRLKMSALAVTIGVLGSPLHSQFQSSLAAEGDPALTAQAVRAHNDFATNLYHQLTGAEQGKNLFFSPYSIFSALMMTAEGARGEAARQMGMVLRFPNTVRNAGDILMSIPWNVAWMRTGMADLQQRLMGTTTDPAQTQGVKKKIKHLEEEHWTLTAKLQQLQAAEQWSQVSEISEQAVAVTHELKALRQQVDQYELRIANALWSEQTFPFRPAFVETLNKAYSAAAMGVDFIGNPKGARMRINDWVEQQTRNRIQNLLAQGMITPETRLVLTNAIYFKGRWAEEFDKQNTQDADFTLETGQTVKTKLMTIPNLKAHHGELLPDGSRNDPLLDREQGVYQVTPNPDGFQILELPYRGNELAMAIILPKRHDNLPAVEQQLTAPLLTAWLETLKKQNVHVFLPQFKLETSYGLTETLSAMGMPAAFQPGGFTGVSDAPEASTLALSAVVHKAFVEVNEEGTEAAAATAVGMRATAAFVEPPTPTFRADRPFLFVIRDLQSGVILFVGRVMNPQSGHSAD